jgi:flagellar basal-body rod protein FlgC
MANAFDISVSGLIAQRVRMNAIANNIANMSSLRDENGDLRPYQARHVIFQVDPQLQTPLGASGVKVASVETEEVEPIHRWQPDHPLAIQDGKWKGYVAYPRVNMTMEMVDSLEATRAYEANIGVIEATKNMGLQTLRILA